MTMKRAILVTGVCLLFAAPFAYADTARVYINFTNPPDPNSDFEGSSYWYDRNGYVAYLGTEGGQTAKGYIKFHIPELEPAPGFATVVNSAIFTWFCSGLNTVDPNLQATLYKVADNSWTHDSIVQYGGGRPPMGDVITTFRPPGIGLENPALLDVTDYLQEVVDAGGTVMSLGADAPYDGANSHIAMHGPDIPWAWVLPYLDVDYTFEEQPLTPGDANGDGHVDLQDFGLLKANFGGTGKVWAEGDFNGDTEVDLQDFGLLKANFGTGGAAVPEPATMSLLAVGACLSLLRGRRR